MSADQPDPCLLQAYLNGSEPAFGTLVDRYLPLVHAAALRQVNDPHAAEDITQAVFILLAQKAYSLRTRPVLSGWLLQTASFCAADLRKRAQRRAFHERKVATMKPEMITPEATVAELAPHLDAALAMLLPTDRDAVVLHFLENQTLQEVGRTLGLSKDAANKRVARALEKLRTRLIRQGLMLSVATLGTLLGAEVLSAASVPTTLAAATTRTAMAAAHGTLTTTTALTLAKGVMHMMFLAKAKLALAATLAMIILATITTTAVHYALAQTLPPTATVPATTSPSMQPAKELTLDLGDKAALKLMLIPAGKFLMGSPDTEKDRHVAEVQHEVTISKPFYMGVTHVTVDQFAAFVQDSGYRTDADNAGWSIGIKITNGVYDHIVGCSWHNPSFDQKGDHPVVEVSWNDATAFCDWLSKKSGNAVTLPTEAQWEYSCRAGTKTVYPWGDNPDDGKGWANCADQSFTKQVPGEAARGTVFTWDDGFAFTSPVGSFKPNGFGLYDMIGNAWQWCQDRYDYPKAGTTASTETGAATDPTGPATGPLRQLRGGSWWGYTDYYRSAYRSIHWEPEHRDAYTGFRVVVVAAGVDSTLPATTAPATTVELDLSTPKNTLPSLAKAMVAGDKVAVFRCLTVDPARKPTVLDALIDWNLAEHRLIRAQGKAFGPNSPDARTATAMLDYVAVIVYGLSQGPDALEITGDSAVFRPDLPPDMLAKFPPQMPKTMKEAFEAWGQGVLLMRRVDKQWKVDLDGSFRVATGLKGTGDAIKDTETDIALFHELASDLNGTAAKVESGELRNLSEVQKDLAASWQKLPKKYPGFTTTTDIAILPAKVREKKTSTPSP